MSLAEPLPHTLDGNNERFGHFSYWQKGTTLMMDAYLPEGCANKEATQSTKLTFLKTMEKNIDKKQKSTKIILGREI